MDKHLHRALVLMDQTRFDLAEVELHQVLTAHPDDPMAHAQLAICLCERREFVQATDEARTAIHLAPDWPFAHYVLGYVYRHRGRLAEANQAAQEALRLNPYDPNHFALLGSIRLEQKQWALALEAAESGLELDAEHVQCNNLRAMALTQLGRKDEARATLASTLARDPEDPFSHANQGWNYLHQGDSKKALEHFREALRLEPNLDYARAGMVEALKARNLIYGLMLKYFLWMGRLSNGAQWGIIIGLYLAYRFLGNLANNNPHWAPWIRPLLVAYIVFAVMTWISSPLFNLLLRLNRFGRYALSRDQIWGANCVAALLFPALTCLVLWLITDKELALLGAVYFGFLLMPVAAIFNCEKGWPRTCLTFYTLALASLGPTFFVTAPGNPTLAGTLLMVFIWGSFLSGIVANFLMMARVQH